MSNVIGWTRYLMSIRQFHEGQYIARKRWLNMSNCILSADKTLAIMTFRKNSRVEGWISIHENIDPPN